MKAITLWQPWASLVVCGFKQYETRSWTTGHRGTLAIHAAKRKPAPIGVTPEVTMAINTILRIYGIRSMDDLPRGAILGTVDLVQDFRTEKMPAPDSLERQLGDYSPGRFAWVLLHPQKYRDAIPARGYQRLWNWDEIR